MSPTKRQIQAIVSVVFPAAIFAAILRVLYVNADTLRHFDYDFDGLSLAAAFVCAVLNVYFLYRAWRLIFHALAGQSPDGVLERIFVYSWVHRYLPGKIWTPVSRVYLGNAHALGKQTLLLSTFVEQGASTLAHFLLALAAAAYVVTHYAAAKIDLDPRVFLVVLPVLLVALHPRTLTLCFRLLFKLVNKGDVPEVNFLSGRRLIQVTAAYVVPLLLMSLSFSLFVQAFFRLSWGNHLIVFCVYMVVNFLAKISLIAPAGMGVREGLLVLSLQAMMGTPVIAGIAVLSRIFFVLVDVILVGAIFVRDRARKRG